MIAGKVTSVFGDDVNTDDIIPAPYLLRSQAPGFFGQYAFERYDPNFIARCKETDRNVVVAGKNFACGSSREQAVYTLQVNNVVCVIARSFADIFFRNSLANGLTLITIPDTSRLAMGDAVEVDLDAGIIHNRTRGAHITFQMKEDDRRIFKQGGTIGQVRAHLEEILQARS
jgi:3-isopropylmalate/(R)-2-methylmalate dehydratase small subunit